MNRIFWGVCLSLLVSLTGCDQLKSTIDKAAAEKPAASPDVTARFCHVARIGNLAEIPDEVWGGSSSDLQAKKDVWKVPAAEIAEIQPAAAQEVDENFLKIVESAAQETTTDEGIKARNKKENELDLAIEMVEEEQRQEEEIQEALQQEEAEGKKAPNQTAKPANLLKTRKETDTKGDEEEILMDSDDLGIEETPEDSAEEDEDTEDADAEEDAETEETEGESAEKADEKTEAEKNSDTALLEAEIDRQAEEFSELLKKIPDEVSEELKKANFRNLSFRMVKIPGSLIFGKTAPEYYVIRTMEYTGSSLSQDFQALAHSPNYSKWMNSLGKYLDIMPLDKNNHEYWAEAPEFWNSEN